MSFSSFVEYMNSVFLPTLFSRLVTIITAPSEYTEMIWILFPMIITLLLMTVYFGRYRKEELGWNTAVGNALVLMFVGIDLLKKVYPDDNPLRALLIFIRSVVTLGHSAEGVLPGVVAGAILCYSLILLTADFFHWLPKRLAFFISSGLPLNVLSYFGIIFVYSRSAGDNILPLDWFTLLAFVILFGILYAVLSFIQTIEPHSDEVKEVMKEAPKPKAEEDKAPSADFLNKESKALLDDDSEEEKIKELADEVSMPQISADDPASAKSKK